MSIAYLSDIAALLSLIPMVCEKHINLCLQAEREMLNIFACHYQKYSCYLSNQHIFLNQYQPQNRATFQHLHYSRLGLIILEIIQLYMVIMLQNISVENEKDS